MPGLRVVIELVKRIDAHHPAVRTSCRTPLCIHIRILAQVAPRIFVPSPGNALLVRAADESAAVAEEIPLRRLSPETVVFVGEAVQSVPVRHVASGKVQKQPLRDTPFRITLDKVLRDFALGHPESFRKIERRRRRRAIRESELPLVGEELNKAIRNVALVPQLDPPLQVRLIPFAVVAPAADLADATIPVVLEVLYLRTIGIFRMCPLARVAARVRLHHAHEPSPEPKHVPDAPVRRISVGRFPALESLVLKTVVDMPMREVRFLEREDAFWQSEGVHVVRIVVLHEAVRVPCEPARKGRAEPREAAQDRAKNQPLPALPFRAAPQRVGLQAEDLRDDVVQDPRPRVLRRVDGEDLLRLQDRTERLLGRSLHDDRYDLLHPPELAEVAHLFVHEVLALRVGLRGVR